MLVVEFQAPLVVFIEMSKSKTHEKKCKSALSAKRGRKVLTIYHFIGGCSHMLMACRPQFDINNSQI